MVAEFEEGVGLDAAEGAGAGAKVGGELLGGHLCRCGAEAGSAEGEAAEIGVHCGALDPCVGKGFG